MAYAQGSVKQVAIVKQSAKGTPGSTGSQLLRRTPGSTFSAPRDTFSSNEIVSHQQSTGITYGAIKPTGKITGELSPATYKLLFAALLRKDFVAGESIGPLTDVTAQVAAPQFVTAAGNFLTGGPFKVGDVLQWTGWATTGTPNNSRNFLITALTATDMTGVFLDGTAPGPKVAGDSVTATVVGKKTLAPLTAHTNDYFTIEEKYTDLVRYELYPDQKVSQAAINLPASGNATVDFDFLGLSRTVSASETLTTATAETTTPVVNSTNGVVYVNGVAVTTVTGAQLTISGSMSHAEPTVGSNNLNDINRGKIMVSGSFTSQFDSVTLQALYDAETPVSLILILNDSPTATSAFVTFTMGRIKITGDAPDDGEKVIVRTYPFTAELNSAGGANLAFDETILSIQDSAA